MCILQDNLVSGEDDTVGKVWSSCELCLLLLPFLLALGVHQDLKTGGNPGGGIQQSTNVNTPSNTASKLQLCSEGRTVGSSPTAPLLGHPCMQIAYSKVYSTNSSSSSSAVYPTATSHHVCSPKATSHNDVYVVVTVRTLNGTTHDRYVVLRASLARCSTVQ